MTMLLTMEFPLDRGIMTTVRLAVGGVCSLLGFGIEAAEDCKVCVTEGLLLLLHAGCGQAKLTLLRGDGLEVRLTGEGGAPSEERSAEEEISVALLTALVEDLSVERGKRCGISFRFKGE